MQDKKYDVFLAYHGSYDHAGSRSYADAVYHFLVENGVSCFYFPVSNNDVYKANIIEVMRAKIFLLVCTAGIHTTENKRLDCKQHYELSTEIDSYYALTQIGENKVQNAKVLACGDFHKGDASMLHELFSNRTHFYYDGSDDMVFPELLNWIRSRIAMTTSWQAQQVTSEIQAVYATRAAMNQDCHFDELIANASNVRAVGISNSEMTARINPGAVANCIKNGGTVEILFLDPDGHYTPLREQEEGLRKNRIKRITEVNIDTALDMYERVPNQENRLRLYLYDKLPRMNMIFIDDGLILQYYANNIAGIDNPTFFIKRTRLSPIYDFCNREYEYLKSEATLIDPKS